MSERMYTATQVENGLLLLRKQMEAEYVKWARLCLDCVRQHVPVDQQTAAVRVAGIPLERIRVDVLGMALKGLPDGIPKEKEQAEEEQGYFA
jgi:hypothetical protein